MGPPLLTAAPKGTTSFYILSYLLYQTIYTYRVLFLKLHKDNAVFPIHLDPNTEYESIVAFCPTSEGKYSGFLTVSLDNAR